MYASEKQATPKAAFGFRRDNEQTACESRQRACQRVFASHGNIQTFIGCGYYPIQWSVDSLDWMNTGKQELIDTALNHKNLKSGAVILMHNGGQYTLGALETIILGLYEKGYEIVPISELIYRDNYYIDGTGKQIAL